MLFVPLLAGAAVSPEEEKLWSAAQGATPPSVIRREARAILEKTPDSFVATYVLGRLESDDGQFPDAIRELKRAQRLATSRLALSRDEKPELTPWQARIALSLADAYDDADRLPEALRAWEEAEALHAETGGMPDRTLRRINALLKLGHIDAARLVANARLKVPELKDNERLALRVADARILFAEEPDGARAYEAFESIAREARGVTSFLFPFGDLAFHARRQGQTDRALAALAESAGIQHATSAAHPFRGMAEIHLAAGNWAAAKSNIRQAWNALQTKRAAIRYELFADTRLCAAYFYLASGYPERAERLVRPYVELPIRSGFSSRPAEQWQAGVNLLCWSASRQIRTLERSSARHQRWYERLTLLGHHLHRRWNEAVMARRIRSLIIAQLRSERPLRDVFELVDAPVWLWGDLATVLGPRQFRKLLAAYPLQGEQHRFFSRAMTVEAASAARDWMAVLQNGEAAIEALPPSEVLLRARMAQVVAEAEYRRGNAGAGMAWLERAHLLDRSAPLKCRSRLLLAEVPDELRGSPLIQVSPAGAALLVEEDGGERNLRMIWPSGRESRFQPLQDAPGNSAARRAYQLHRMLFSSTGLLEESDYAALEGNAMAGSIEKEDRMDRMLRANAP
ncbi:MAG TPA: hypothetical protein PKE12_02110 [Kiritimatiellia bacterium]|nr:hypothetical protein [Kiritimatiellia bacterium]